MSDVGMRRYKWLLPVALILGALFATPLGRWMMSAAWPGSGTQNAYEAFGQMEWAHPDAKTLTPLGRAELELSDERLAAQLAGRPRIHPPGTLVTLQYTTVGASGEDLDRWRLRVIVPMLGDGGELDAEVWTARVPDIELRLKQEGVTILRRSGTTGLPPEAVLRFRVGETIEIEPADDFVATDSLNGTTYHVRKQVISLATGSVTSPARIRVRLIDTCAADVRIGRSTKIEFAPFAPVPIPIGFREQRWVQMTGCAPRATEAESLLSELPAGASVSDGQNSPLLRIGRDGSVHVHETSLQAENRPLRYRIETVCRFDAEQDRWQVLLQSPQSTTPVELAPLPRDAGTTDARIVARLPPVALYWLRWAEGFSGENVTALRPQHVFGFVGGMLCEDIDLGPAPVGRVATCVPFSNRAEAKFVPDPILSCAPQRGL